MLKAVDGPVRLAYSQAGFVHALAAKTVMKKAYESDFKALQDRFDTMHALFSKNGISFEGARVLELGPGNASINAFNALSRGASSVTLVDKFSRVSDSDRQAAYERREEEWFLSQTSVSEGENARLPRREIDKGKIEFVERDIRDMTSPEADVMLSVSVLEHVKDVEGTVRAMASLLKSGGAMYHHIDMRDHFDFSSPFLFYKYSDKTWERWMSKEGRSYTNRMRMGEFLDVFRACGLEVVENEPLRESLEGVETHEDMLGRPDLDVGIMNVIVRKP